MPAGHRPPLPPPLARVALNGTLFGIPWTSVFYLDLGGGSIVTADLNTLATQIATTWNTNVAPVTSVDTILSEVDIVYVPSPGNELTGIWTGTHTGSLAGTTINNTATCAVVNFHINAYYRGGHPRMYMPGITVGDATGGTSLTSGARSNIATAWTAVLTALNAYTTGGITSVAMGTVSFQSGNAWRGTPLFRAYKSVTVRTLLGTQRRRIKV